MIVIVLLIALLLPATAWAQEIITSCATASWAANAEPDLAGYRLYVEKNGIALPMVEVGKGKTAHPCAAIGITEGGDYSLMMTAFDTSGNESAKTVPVLVSWSDVTAPDTPLNVCIDATVNGAAKQLCVTIIP